jgi:1-acyl-sn-glycerol-3-phosphate acyltransferase
MTVVPFVPVHRPVGALRSGPHADAATRCRRWLRLAGVLAGAAAGSVRAPVSGARGRRRLAVCAAARALTALGVRVEVRPARVAWPRTGPGHLVVVADRVGWLAGLALLTAVPGLPVTTPEVAGWPVLGRLVRRSGVVVLDAAGRATLAAAAGDPAAPICPVEVRCGPGTPAAGGLTWRALGEVVAARDVVVAVQLLPALDRAPAGRLARDVRA